MKALVVVALMWTASVVSAEPQTHVGAGAVAGAAAVAQGPQVTANTVRPDKVNQCVQQRLNLSKSSFSPFAGGPVSSATSTYGN